MKRLTRRQLDEMLATGRIDVEQCDELRELDNALALAKCYIANGRAIPSHVVMKCIARARHWKNRDIPAAIVEARKTWLRAREAKELAERMGSA